MFVGYWILRTVAASATLSNLFRLRFGMSCSGFSERQSTTRVFLHVLQVNMRESMEEPMICILGVFELLIVTLLSQLST